jgi:hypothetical protein
VNRNRPWWQWLLVGVVALVILGALLGDGDEPSADEDAVVERTTTLPPVDDAATEADAIGRRIADGLGRRAIAAIKAGDRGRARALIIEAGGYPSTALVREARVSYKVAKALAVQRREAAARERRAEARAAQRREAAARQRRAAAERRERERAAQQLAPEPESAGGCDSNYTGCVPAYPPDVNCPQVDGPVQVIGSDPHGLDRDGDGVACEG